MTKSPDEQRASAFNLISLPETTTPHEARVRISHFGELNITAANRIANDYMEAQFGPRWDEQWKIEGGHVDSPGTVDIVYTRGTHLSPEDVAERTAEDFIELYAILGQSYRLRPDLDPPAALRAKADEMEAFQVVIFDPKWREFFQEQIAFLREIADIIDLPTKPAIKEA